MVVPTVDCSGGHAIHPRVGHPATYSSSSSSSSSSRREMKRNAVGIADSRNFSGDTLPENSGGVTNAQERETKLAHSIGTYPVVFANSRFHRRKRERERERERKGATKHESPSRCALCPFSVRTTLSPPTPATPPVSLVRADSFSLPDTRDLLPSSSSSSSEEEKEDGAAVFDSIPLPSKN